MTQDTQTPQQPQWDYHFDHDGHYLIAPDGSEVSVAQAADLLTRLEAALREAEAKAAILDHHVAVVKAIHPDRRWGPDRELIIMLAVQQPKAGAS